MRNFTTVGLSIRQNFGIPFIENLNITPNDFFTINQLQTNIDKEKT